MQDTMSSESLYTRTKDTFKVLFQDTQITEPERAKLGAEYASQMSIQLSSVAMQTAVQWAKEERDGVYTLAKVKAEADLALANLVKVKEEICLVQAQTNAQCASALSTLASSQRENGVATVGSDGCSLTGLDDSGLKYAQTKQVESATYQTYADAYRKSGVVGIGISTDGVIKGITGGTDPIVDGYTNQQSLNAERQRQSYEDSKINHMLNSVAVVTGQMMSADIGAEQWLLDYMKCGMGSLLSPNSETPKPFGTQTCSNA